MAETMTPLVTTCAIADRPDGVQSIASRAWRTVYSPECVEGEFSEVRQKDSRPSPYRLRKDHPFTGYAPLAPPLSYYCYVCRGGVLPYPPSLYREG